MNAVGEWIARAWRESDLSKSRGDRVPDPSQALYRWRLSDAEIERAMQILRRHLPTDGSAGREVAACFCLVATHVLQRRYGHGNWSWDIVTDVIGIDLDQARLRDLTEKGLARLQRPLRQTEHIRQFFRSLVLESGIPSGLIDNGAGVFARYLRRLQVDLDEYDVKERGSAETFALRLLQSLPAAWRRDEVAALAADLLLALRPFRDQLPPDILASRAIPWLDDREPAWRESLPLPLNDEGAERLLAQLIVERRAPRERRDPQIGEFCRRGVFQVGGEWRTGAFMSPAGIVLPNVLPPTPFAGVDAPHRVRLFVESDRPSTSAGQLGIIESLGNNRWRFAPTVSRPVEVNADDPLVCRMVVDRDDAGDFALPGGGALPLDLPWTLIDDADLDIGSPDRLRFVGTGGLNSRRARLFLAFDPATGGMEVEEGTVENLGMVHGTSRQLIEVRGAVIWRDSGGPDAIRLRTGARVDEAARIALSLRPPRWSIDAAVVSLGVPTAGVTGTDPRGHRLQWRYGVSDAWKAWASVPSSGSVELAIIGAGGFLLDRVRVVVLPEETDLRARAIDQGCAIRCGGMSIDQVRVEGATSWRRVERADGQVIEAQWARDPPTEVTVVTRLDGPNGIDVRHHLPVRGRLPVFVGVDSKPIAANRMIVAADVEALRASSDGQAEIIGRVGLGVRHAAGARAVSIRTRFVDDIPLRRLRSRLLGLLGVADDLDAHVTLELLGGGVAGARLDFRYVDKDLRFETMARLCLLEGATDDGAALTAWPIQRPAEAKWPLPRIAPDQWRLPGPEQPGTWLIVGTGTLDGRVRPRVWYAGPGDTADGRLAGTASMADARARREAFAAIMRQMANSPWAPEDESDWVFLEDSVLALQGQVPLIAVDTLRTLTDVPEAWLAMLLRASDDMLPSVARIVDELPLLPALVPLAQWKTLFSHWRTRFAAVGKALVDELTARRLQSIVDLMPQLAGAAWYVRETFGIAHPAKAGESTFAATRKPQIQAHFRAQLGEQIPLAPWRQEVAGTRDWGNLSRAVRMAAPVIAATTAIDAVALRPSDRLALRFIRDDAPDSFDQAFRDAFQLRLSEQDVLP